MMRSAAYILCAFLLMPGNSFPVEQLMLPELPSATASWSFREASPHREETMVVFELDSDELEYEWEELDAPLLTHLQQCLYSADPEIRFIHAQLAENSARQMDEMNSGGWDLVLEGEWMQVDGQRTRKRTDIGGRTPRFYDNKPLSQYETNWFVGFEKPFFEREMTRKSRMARMRSEQTMLLSEMYRAQHKVWEEFAKTLSDWWKAYSRRPVLEQVYLTRIEIERILRVRSETGDALPADVLRAEAEVVEASVALRNADISQHHLAQDLARLLGNEIINWDGLQLLMRRLSQPPPPDNWQPRHPEHPWVIRHYEQLLPDLAETTRIVGRAVPDVELAVGVELGNQRRYYFDDTRLTDWREWTVGFQIEIPLKALNLARARQQRLAAVTAQTQAELDLTIARFEQNLSKYQLMQQKESLQCERIAVACKAAYEAWKLALQQKEVLPLVLGRSPRLTVLGLQARYYERVDEFYVSQGSLALAHLYLLGLSGTIEPPCHQSKILMRGNY